MIEKQAIAAKTAPLRQAILAVVAAANSNEEEKQKLPPAAKVRPKPHALPPPPPPPQARTKYVLPQKHADKKPQGNKPPPPPTPPPVPQQHKPTKKADTEEEDDNWGEWTDKKSQQIPNMEEMPRGTRAYTPNKTTSAAASSKSRAHRATTASKTPPPKNYGVWAGDIELEEEQHSEKKRDFSTGEGRARFVKEEITNLLFWQTSAATETLGLNHNESRTQHAISAH